jgi:uncharacterized membrane protein
MFETVLGIPAHPLLVHAAVIFIPLQLLGAVVYALVPRVRPRIGWATAALIVIGPVAAWFAKLSGDAFKARLGRRGTTSGAFFDKIVSHQHLGTFTAWFSLGLAAATLLLMLQANSSAKGNQPLSWALKIIVLGLAVTTGYYVFKTGDSGAHIVWSGQ